MVLCYTPGENGFYTSIAIDSNNLPHISYNDQTNGDLKYAKKVGGSWVKEVVDSTGNVGSWSSIAIDPSSGRREMSYLDATNQALKYALIS
jgi:hypothetical protein